MTQDISIQITPELLELYGFEHLPILRHFQKKVFQYRLNEMEVVLIKYGESHFSCVQKGNKNESINDVAHLKKYYHDTTGKYLPSL